MKKIVFINSVIGVGSTGKICVDLANDYKKKGYDVKIAYGRGCCDEKYKKCAIRIGNFIDVIWHVIMTRLFDRHGLCSVWATKKFLKWLDKYNPDIIWMHNIHGYYINYEFLFDWLKKHPDIEKKWTLHDCWAFTGHCAHYTYNKCYKWKTKCNDCGFYNEYPRCVFIENSNNNFNRKKFSFLNVKKLEIITPSYWLKDEVKKSFLKSYDISVIHNTIDKNIFKPIKSDLREKLGLKNKFVILAVANVWTKRKGLYDILELSKMLDDKYEILIVGVNKKQLKKIKNFYDNVIILSNISNKEEVAKMHNCSNLFFDRFCMKTYELVNAKTALCNTKTVFCNKEVLVRTLDNKNGIAIKPGVENLYKAIMKISRQQTANNKQQTININSKQQTAKILLINKTNNKYDLARLYSSANVFINPTYEDNYPTVNLESLACGTKVITYNVGGCRETIW